MTEKIPYSSKKEMLAKRHPYIGGSDIGAICEVNPYKTPADVWLDKTGDPKYKTVDPFGFSVFMGSNMEETVAKYYEHLTGKKVHRVNYMKVKDGFKAANPDRIVYGEKTILECKTTASFNTDEWEEGKMPENYRHQINWYLGIWEYEKADILCANFVKKDWDMREHIFDPELFAYQEEKAREMQEHIINRTLPKLTAQDTELLIETDKSLETKEADPYELAEYAIGQKKIQAIKEELKEAEKWLKDKEAEFIQKYEGAELVAPNYTLSHKWIGGLTFDSKRFAQEYPDLYADFTVDKKPYLKWDLKENK